MAIKERLLKQLQIVRDGLNAMPPFHSRDLNAMRNALVQARDLCFQGLSASRLAEYKDTYDGLLLALEQLAADAPDKDEIVSLCSELLQYMIAQTQKETAFKKEIFFLPYKASMWDSLESVWKAADEDKEHCIAYVMPIPYADLTPEHTVAEWHCERDLFPKDVPTVKWEEFNLEEIHPDVIFIHNPYDECNRVTSVESRFYSSILKNQTDKLVYIPYFVLGEPEFDGKSEEEIETMEAGIEHFVTTPAVLNAHQVIVQSEAMRRVYIDVLTRETNRKERAFWEKRILGMGSPKFDKVATTKREDLDIPEQWLKIIRKPDGSWKKIVFYNTGLSALLHNDEKMLVKMRQVFQTFKEHKDEIALLWRPHPLIPATIQSMRPQLSEEYAGIVKQYKEDAWGIYDDSADMDRAVVLSDAYYGDWSSVVQLYQKTGKPLMIQKNEEIDYSFRAFNRNARFSDAVNHHGVLYFSDCNFNGLFRCIGGKKEAEFLGRFPLEEQWQVDLHRAVFFHNEKLFFVPMHGDIVSVYDLKEKIFHSVMICHREKKMGISYIQSIKIDDDVLMIPINTESPFALMHLRTMEIDILSKLTEAVKRNLPDEVAKEEIFSSNGAIVYNSKIYLVIGNTPVLLEVNPETWDVSRYTLPNGIHLCSINVIDDFFWFTLHDNAILRWNLIDGTYKLYMLPCEPSGEKFPYLQIFKADAGMLVVPGRCDRLWLLDPEKKKFFDLTANMPIEALRTSHQGGLLFMGYLLRGKTLYLFPRKGNHMLIYHLANGEMTFCNIKISANSIDALVKQYALSVVRDYKVIDEAFLALHDFLMAVLVYRDEPRVSFCKASSGADIYKFLGLAG